MTATCLLLLPIYCWAETDSSQLDPLDSPQWQVMHETILNSESVIFDESVTVITPEFAEDPMNVPVAVSVKGLENIEEIVVFADLNPITKILAYQPLITDPYISFRFKVEQSTPVRAAAKTSDGVWHIGGQWLSASGGGCTAPSNARVEGGWETTLGDVSSRTWLRKDGTGRLRFKIMHPMDTGLAPGIPEFYIQQIHVTDGQGKTIAHIEPYQPISENPVMTLNLPATAIEQREITLSGRDNNGNKINSKIY